MRYLVDTDWIIDYLVENSPALALLSTLAKEGIAVSLITLGEIYGGIYYGRNPQEDEVNFQRFLRTVDVLPLTQSCRNLGVFVEHCDVDTTLSV